eukprot:2303023-Rhodomonas_salina.3
MVQKAYADEQVFLDHVRKLKGTFSVERSRLDQVRPAIGLRVCDAAPGTQRATPLRMTYATAWRLTLLGCDARH